MYTIRLASFIFFGVILSREVARGDRGQEDKGIRRQRGKGKENGDRGQEDKVSLKNYKGIGVGAYFITVRCYIFFY